MSPLLARTSPRLGTSTPVWLWRSLVAVVLAALLAGGIALWAAASISGAAQTIGRDAEPSVALALQMAAALSDMDASVLADSLTEGGAAAGTSEVFRRASQVLADDLVRAAENVTYETERQPLRDLQRWLLGYQAAVVEARDAGSGAGGNAWLAAHRVRWASRVNRDFAAPAAAALAKANQDELEARYSRYRSGSIVFAVAAAAAFGLLVVVLGVVQLWLVGRVRRLVNPLLAAATAVAVVGGLWFVVTALTERENLRAAKNDAYDSLLVLFEAKGAANELRGTMSAWLLDPAGRAEADRQMNVTTRRLIEAPLDDGLMRRLQEALVLEDRGDAAQAVARVGHLGGLLGTEMDNVTYGMAERRPASAALMRLRDALGLIGRVRQDAVTRPGEAVRVWTDDAPGRGGAAFAAIQAALDETIRVNQREFDLHVGAALALAQWLPWTTVAALLLTVGLASGGLWQRLREYR